MPAVHQGENGRPIMGNPATVWIDQIPVVWYEPTNPPSSRQLAIFLTHLGGTKERTRPYLEDIATAGFIALSFDPWQHGERRTIPDMARADYVFEDFRRRMWPIIGQSTIDTMRVIDWAVANLHVSSEVRMGGMSMGGDIAVAAAGIDHRINRVAAVVATPDWLRPGMQDLFHPGSLVPPGAPDSYARYFYDNLNPLTHLSAYSHGPFINFICGDKDTHVPPDGALRFQREMRKEFPSVADRVVVDFVPEMTHMGIRDSSLWWPQCLEWMTQAFA